MIALGLASWLVVGSVGPSIAAAAPATSPHAEGHVEIHVVGSPEDSDRVATLIAEQLELVAVSFTIERMTSLALDDVFVPPADPRPALARVFVDLDRGPMVFIVDAEWERVLARRIDGSNGLDAVTSEELGLIVVGGVEALLAGGTIGIGREEARAAIEPERAASIELEPPTPPAPQPEPQREVWRPSVSAWASYVVRGWATEVGPVHGAWIGAALRDARALGLGASLAVGVERPPTARVGALAFEFTTVGLRAQVGLEPRLAPDWQSFVAELGGGVDLLRVGPRALDDLAQPAPPSWTPLAKFDARIGPVWFVGRGPEQLRIALVFELVVTPSRFAVTANDGAERFVPWQLAPAGVVELGWRHRGRGKSS